MLENLQACFFQNRNSPWPRHETIKNQCVSMVKFILNALFAIKVDKNFNAADLALRQPV